MARPRKKKPAVDHLLITEEPKTEWQKALAHLEENYKIYIAGALFLLMCVTVGALIRISADMRERERASLYAEAALIEDATQRLEKYREVVDSLGRWRPEALYRMGETAIEAEQYDEAEEIFAKLTSEYPGSEFIPNAVDALAYIAWNRGELEAALAGFERVAQDWPGELIGRRKHYEIGQVLEEMERIEDAIAAYNKQISVFPDSAIARRAQQALDALKKEHPDLFPEEEEVDESIVEKITGDEEAEEQEPTDTATIEDEPDVIPDETTEADAAPGDESNDAADTSEDVASAEEAADTADTSEDVAPVEEEAVSEDTVSEESDNTADEAAVEPPQEIEPAADAP